MFNIKDKIWFVIGIILLLILTVFVVSNAECSNDFNISKFTIGAIGEFALHELGHEIAADINGVDLDWKFEGTNPKWQYNRSLYSRNKLATVNMAGLLAGVIPTELIIRTKTKNSYADGFVAFHAINSLLYSTKYIFGKDDGDLSELEINAGRSTANLFAIAITGISLYQGYEYFFGSDYDDDVCTFNLVPVKNGAMIEFRFEF